MQHTAEKCRADVEGASAFIRFQKASALEGLDVAAMAENMGKLLLAKLHQVEDWSTLPH